MKTAARLILVLVVLSGAVRAFEFDSADDAHGYPQTFRIDPQQKPCAWKVTLLSSTAAGNVFHPGEQTQFAFQLENLTDAPIQTAGKVDVIRYGGRAHATDMWVPEFFHIADVQSIPIEVDLAAKSWQDITVNPQTPETKGGYAMVVDLGKHGRQVLTSYVRTFRIGTERVQFPKQSLENMPPEILSRLGVQAIRYGVAYHPSDSRRYAEHVERLDSEFKAMHAHKVTCTVEIGTAHEKQPLGRGRPHLDENGVMKGGKEDLAWLPEADDDYEKFVYTLASTYGWPKGPVTGFMLWNEPWEGLSISGWGADMIRYRTLYQRMGDAIFRARKDAGVDVLVGGCDSSTNTWDKLFPDGTDTFLPYLDFCSIHYQGMSAPVLYPMWHNRKHYKGRVLIWDTESWVANTDDRFAGVVATNRAAGYDRSMGIRGSNVTTVLSHHRIARDTIRTAEGTAKVVRPIQCWPVGAAVGAVQHFIGERDFREILFRNGLPWVYVFDGLGGNPDDGTVVVVGDVGTLFGKKGAQMLFGTVERNAEAATLTLDATAGPFHTFDYYGNPVPPKGRTIVVPLTERGVFLRADPAAKGSFAKLLDALRQSRISGIEALEIIPYDLLAPVESKPTLRLRVTNMLNRRIQGMLMVTVGKLSVQAPQNLEFGPREQQWVEVKILGGKAAPDNAYALEAVFAGGPGVGATHRETMHVNVISRKAITVDGKLDDWQGALPQTIRAAEAAEASFEEAMWLPFVPFKPGTSGGLATAYLAHDAEHFYFAAKIADDSPHPGAPRFETRDPDADFYPQTCISVDPRTGRRQALVWPEGVRRFSYRRWPAMPSGYGSVKFDNVLIAFNVLPPGEDGWMTHLPGRMPKFVAYKTTDYEYALNRVADAYGGGTEIWRLEAPGMPRKHFYPRQPKHPLEGAVKKGRLAVRYEGGTRIVECAIPWDEIPHVKQRLDAGKTIKFSYRVNHDTGGPTMELATDRSAAEGLSSSFHPDWSQSYPNELEFAFER